MAACSAVAVASRRSSPGLGYGGSTLGEHREKNTLPRCVAVAVPAPLHQPLTYTAPAHAKLQTGVRVRVPLGRRSVVGIIVEPDASAPADIEPQQLKPIGAVLDDQPVVPRALLDLARFTADYYLAPIGEVLRGVVPSGLESWGARRIRSTDRGMLQARGEGLAKEVRALLIDRGALRQHEVVERIDTPELGATLEEMRERGWIRIESDDTASGRYRTAYEAVPGERQRGEEVLARSPKARAAFAWLLEAGRPASSDEICRAADCSSGVVRRLDELGLVRKFTEVRQQPVDRHLLASATVAPFELRADQSVAVRRLEEALARAEFSPWLLRGMTGSGKTEVYLRAIAHSLGQQRGSIVMVPEIAMVPALARTLVERFAGRVAVLHSNLSRAERSDQWQRIRSGAAQIVVGPRSAVFAPLKRLGLVVVDEEHDAAYKQDATPRYNGRDLALVRARSEGATALLASATPSLESRLNVARERYGELELTERVGEGGLPEGVLVDLRRESFSHRPGEVHFSQLLRSEIEAALKEERQIILLRNRRGFAPLLLCRACGEDQRCEDCGLPRTWHRREGRMLCHYCGSMLPVPKRCPSCGEAALEAIGAGTERVEDDFRSLFPGVEVATLDRDSTQRRGGVAAVLERFRSGRTRVLVGTQMVAKGHHFPNVPLVAVMSADTYLGFPDFRAVERTYNLLTQVAGRAGRGDRRGRFVIQTHHPEHYAIQAALHHDDDAFAREELRFREIFHYPPFTRMVALLLQDRGRERAESRMREIARRIERHPLARGLRIVGPAPAAFEKLRGRWRFQMLLRGASGRRIRRLLEDLGLLEIRELTIDVDPQDLL